MQSCCCWCSSSPRQNALLRAHPLYSTTTLNVIMLTPTPLLHCPLPPPQIATLSALAYHKSTGRKATQPNQRMGFAENFLFMLDANGVPTYR